jgi:hypothetical protein
MPARDLDAVFYAGDVPRVEYRDGMFHVSYNIRNCYFEFVMPPHVFTNAVLLAEDAVAKWRLDQTPRDNVTPMRRKKH